MYIATCWDDGLVSDLYLIEVLDRYSVTASFALNIDLHANNPTLNDHRSVEYGYRVSKDCLKEFVHHDVLNHTATHLQMDAVPLCIAQQDIMRGKDLLEQVCGHKVAGIVWPYGISTEATRNYAKMIGHTFGRITPSAGRKPSCEAWDVVPHFTWRTPPEIILEYGTEHMLITGHTYEMRTRDDWDAVTELYRTLATDNSCALVSLTRLVELASAK